MKMVGPFDKEQSKHTINAIKEFVDNGNLDAMEDQDLFPDADIDEIITITNNPEKKK